MLLDFIAHISAILWQPAFYRFVSSTFLSYHFMSHPFFSTSSSYHSEMTNASHTHSSIRASSYQHISKIPFMLNAENAAEKTHSHSATSRTVGNRRDMMVNHTRKCVHVLRIFHFELPSN